MEANKKQNIFKFLNIIGLIVGVGMGYFLGLYTGFNFIIPIVLTFIFALVVKKVYKQVLIPMIPAIAVLGGSLFWILLGTILTKSISSALIEIILLLIGLIWLIIRPGISSVIFLTAYLVFALFGHILGFLSVKFGTEAHKALLVHIILKISILLSMFVGLKLIRKQKIAI